jgi:3-oxoacyl-[acyl-carrier-protein] synthase-3
MKKEYHKVYINSIGKHLPNSAVHNDEMEDYLGLIGGKPSRTRERMLKQNGIITRYYALDKDQQSTDSVSGMANKAIQDCLEKGKVNGAEIELLTAGTTQGDLPVPGFASMVHAESKLPVCNIVSHQSVCASGIMALKSAYLHVLTGENEKAISCASDMPSRMFKSSRYDKQDNIQEKGLPLDTDFLRWMLSDGAGAMYLSNKPNSSGLSLEIEWIDVKSYANSFGVCMYAGTNKKRDGTIDKYWLDYANFSDADADSAINLKQDIKLVNNTINLGVQHLFELIDKGEIDPKKMDWLVCHYSSEYFKQPIVELLKKGGLEIADEKWFTNLHEKGNTGSASIYIMLEELLYSGRLQPNQEIICMVPESGRFITTFMKLKVVGDAKEEKQPLISKDDEILAPEIHIDNKPIQEKLVRDLTQIWVDFELSLRNTPIIDRIYNGTISLEDYKLLLLNLRQQVIDGSQWIARAASNVSMDYFDIRSSFISHSRDEHKDYQILEKNYINCGGKKEDLYSGEKNIGSEALSAYMFHKASQPNPFDLLGGMFIIEGLGNRLAGKWGRAIQHELDLKDDQVSFFIYHETSDSNDNHFERFEKALNSELLTEEMAKRVSKTAKVVAKLYQMQLAEIGNY